MFRQVLKSKIHRATVTADELDYEGSLTLDRDLMDRAKLVVNEKIAVWNVTTGARFETYVIEGRPGSGEVCVNGAAAHRAKRGDIVIIASFAWLGDDDKPLPPAVVRVDGDNRPLADDRPERAP